MRTHNSSFKSGGTLPSLITVRKCPISVGGLSRTRTCWLEQLDRIPVGILELNLFAAGSDFHLIPKTQAVSLERVDMGRKVDDSEDDPIPATRFLMTTVGQRSGA